MLATPPLSTFGDLLCLAPYFDYVTISSDNCNLDRRNTILYRLNWRFTVNLNLNFMFRMQKAPVGMKIGEIGIY
jgi:hypothetical protein